jgi:hypothetical protein
VLTRVQSTSDLILTRRAVLSVCAAELSRDSLSLASLVCLTLNAWSDVISCGADHRILQAFIEERWEEREEGRYGRYPGVESVLSSHLICVLSRLGTGLGGGGGLDGGVDLLSVLEPRSHGGSSVVSGVRGLGVRSSHSDDYRERSDGGHS